MFSSILANFSSSSSTLFLLRRAFAEFATRTLPVAEDVCARQVCLPVHSDMTDDEVDQVLTAAAA